MINMMKYNELTEEKIEKLDKYIRDKIVFEGKVKLTQRNESLATEVLIVDFDGDVAFVKREDLDYQVNWRSLVPFVGESIDFTVKEYDEETGIIFLSRKEAQLQNLEQLKIDLEGGQTFTATITGLLDYGAYVSINGAYALMRNVDFSNGYIKISDELDVDDEIEVKLRSVSQNGRIAVEPVNKRIVDSILTFDMFEAEQVVEGVVRSVRSFGAFVGIAPGIDALCNVPATGEIEEGSRVSFKITKVFTDDRGEEKVRGKILSILE